MSATSRLSGQARTLIGIVVAVGGAALAVRATEILGWKREEAVGFAILAAAVILSEQFQLPFQRGPETHNFNLADAVWTAGLLLVEPSVLTVAVAVGVLAGESLRGWSPLKIAFNVGQSVFGITAATMVFNRLGAGSLEDPRMWAAAALAMAAFFVVNTVAIGLATTGTHPN